MALTSEQIKGRLKNIAKNNNADARILIRIYMMERFLERLANSKYAENFIIKGGILVTSMIGVSRRSTMDIDTTIRNLNLSEEDALKVINEIASIDMGDDVVFKVKDVSHIMDEMEYPGIRINMDAAIGKMVNAIKIDISTGDVITPRAIEYKYPLMLEDKTISLWSYNLETILAEKLETILSRGLLNTRMRDFYDVNMLLSFRKESINIKDLKDAFKATSVKRDSTVLFDTADNIIAAIASDENLRSQWRAYQKKYNYAADVTYDGVIESVKELKNTCI